MLDKIVKTLKPRGILLVVDHSSKPEAGNSQAGSLHRIEESYAERDFPNRPPLVHCILRAKIILPRENADAAIVRAAQRRWTRARRSSTSA